MAIPLGFHADQLDPLTRTRTSTRPPPPPHPTPCPYRTAYVSCCIRSSKFIRGLSEAKRSGARINTPCPSPMYRPLPDVLISRFNRQLAYIIINLCKALQV